MKLKSIILLAVVTLASSCGISDLEDRVGKIENALGTNEPFTVKFSTKNYDDVDVVDNTTYLFKSGGDSEYIGINPDGTMSIYIERFSDVEWNEGAWIDFDYDPTTKEITNERAGTYFYNRFEQYMNTRFYSSDTECAITVTVNKIDTSTGLVDVSVEASTTANSGYNYFETKPMTGTFKFRGKLPVFEWDN